MRTLLSAPASCVVADTAVTTDAVNKEQKSRQYRTNDYCYTHAYLVIVFQAACKDLAVNLQLKHI
jgi:hypothetical protein